MASTFRLTGFLKVHRVRKCERIGFWKLFPLKLGEKPAFLYNVLIFSHLLRVWAVALLLSLSLVGCENPTRPFFTRPGHKIASEFNTKRVVMLGDFEHGNALSYYGVTSVLNDWLDMLQSGEKGPRHLTLVLEGDDSLVSVLKDYISSGDEQHLLDYWLPFGELERLEFYHDLRTVCQRIKKINQVLPETQEVTFDILGGEPVADLKSDSGRDRLKWSRKQIDSWFVKTRDSVVADRIESYLRTNPLQRALVFYGGGHLMEGLVSKKPYVASSDADNANGYFLAHYLRRYFGKDSVLTVDQTVLSTSYFKGTRYAAAGDSDILVYRPELPFLAPYLKRYDCIIFRHEPVVPSHSLDDIFSRKVIEKCFQTIDMESKYLPGFFARSNVDELSIALQIVTGHWFSSRGAWQAWYKGHKYDGLARLGSESFIKPMLEHYQTNNPYYESTLQMYSFVSGLPFSYLKPSQMIDTRQWWDAACKDIQERIECGNAIGIYWIGYPDEQKEAHQWLVKYTGKNFSTPDQYLKWWRHVVFNANY